MCKVSHVDLYMLPHGYSTRCLPRDIRFSLKTAEAIHINFPQPASASLVMGSHNCKADLEMSTVWSFKAGSRLKQEEMHLQGSKIACRDPEI